MNAKLFFVKCALPALLAFAAISPSIAAPTSTPASATYSLDATASKLGTGPYASVVLTQYSNYVSFLITPSSGYAFANTGGKHWEFAFNTSSAFDDASVAMTGAAASYFHVASGTSFDVAGYGSFEHAITFNSTVGKGLSASVTTPISFNVSKANISLNDFVANANGVFFATDIGNLTTGMTGNAVSSGNPTLVKGTTPDSAESTSVPEPASLALLAIGALGLAATRRRT